MRMRSHRRNLAEWSAAAAPASRSADQQSTRLARSERIRWWLRTGVLLTVIGVRRLARIMRARWRPACRLNHRRLRRMTCSVSAAVRLARSYTPSSLACHPLVPSGGVILGGIAAAAGCASTACSATCPPPRQTLQPDRPCAVHDTAGRGGGRAVAPRGARWPVIGCVGAGALL